MGELVVTEFMTLDGVVEDPGGSEGTEHGGWSFKFPDDEGMKFKLDETLDAGSLLLGRVTYEGFAAAWPGRRDDAGFADKMNEMPKYVVSSTLSDPAWNNTTVLSGDVAGEVAALKEREEGIVLVAGSVSLVAALREHDLVDEYRLMVHPIVLGSGKRLFSDAGGASVLELAGSRTLGSGSLILTYRPV
jgi:dihydrofolate reductase